MAWDPAPLNDPGMGTCISLLQTTTFLLTTEPELGDLVTALVLRGLGDEAERAFVAAHERLTADEEAIRAESTGGSDPKMART